MKPAETGKDDKPQQGSDVTITYNGDPVVIHRGNYTVAELRQTLKVPNDEVLSQMVNGAFQPLTEGHVVIKGGEIFAAHKPQGGAS